MPQLIVVEQGKEERQAIPCSGDTMGIGRLGTNAVVLNHEAVSRQHAQVLLDGDDYFVVDLGSDNGTLLNNSLIQAKERYLLRNGDVITINGFHIHFSRADELEQSFNEITDSEIVEVKMLKKVLRALDKDTLPSLEVLNGNAEGQRNYFPENQDALILGRDAGCDFAIDEYVMSRQHAKLTRRGSKVYLEDLQSKNGTYINNERISEPRYIQDGDRIACGTVVLLFRNPQDVNIEEVSQELREQYSKDEDAEHSHAGQEELEPSTEAEEPADETHEEASIEDYPTPKPRKSFLSRLSMAEVGLLWAGIMVFLITIVLIVQLFN